MTLALDAGASDFNVSGEVYEITTEPSDFEAVKKAVTDAGLKTESAEVTKIPSALVKVAGVPEAKAVLGLIESLEEHDDVQNVYANFDIPDTVLQELSK